MTTTALDLIESAMSKLGLIGAADEVDAEDAALCLKRLNALIDADGGDNVFGYDTLETIVSLTAGDSQLTVGSGLNIDIARPVSFLRQSFARYQDIDYPILPIDEVEWAAIPDKTSTALVPEVMFYGGQLSSGTLDFYPVPTVTSSLHLFTATRMAEITNTATAMSLAPGYQRYFELQLALEIAPDYEKQPSPLLLAMAASAKRIIRRTNSVVPQLDFEPRNSGHRYSAYSILNG